MEIFRLHGGLSHLEFVPYFRKTTIYKCDHAGQLPESVVSSVNMLTLSVHEIYIFIFSYEKEGKNEKNTIDCFLISYLVQEKSTFQQYKWHQ